MDTLAYTGSPAPSPLPANVPIRGVVDWKMQLGRRCSMKGSDLGMPPRRVLARRTSHVRFVCVRVWGLGFWV
jgi:hypothetical protein